MGDERVTGTGGRLRQLARHSFVYGLGGLVSKLVGIFLLPIYTHRVNQAQFGEVEQVMAFVAVAAIVLRMGLVTAMFRFCWDHREPDARAPRSRRRSRPSLRCRRSASSCACSSSTRSRRC